MKLFQASIVMMLVVVLAACGGKKDAETANANEMKPGMEMKMDETTAGALNKADIAYYTCPMESHKDVHSSEPGKCSKCNMDLVPAVFTDQTNVEYWGCPMEMHSDVRMDKAGKCPKCNMDLKAMRLEKSEG